MNELKCKECGTTFIAGAKECPSCGCPVEEVKVTYVAETKVSSANKFDALTIISLLLGIAIIVMGITVLNKEVSIDTYTAKNYDVDHAAFGADFYTEIYGASDIIVDELNDINSGVEVLSEIMVTMVNAIYYPIGMTIIAFGLGVVAVSVCHIKKRIYR